MTTGHCVETYEFLTERAYTLSSYALTCAFLISQAVLGNVRGGESDEGSIGVCDVGEWIRYEQDGAHVFVQGYLLINVMREGHAGITALFLDKHHGLVRPRSSEFFMTALNVCCVYVMFTY